MFNKILKPVVYFVNTVLLSVIYVTIKAFIIGYSIFDVGIKVFVDYTSTIFIESLVVSVVLLIVISLVIKFRKKNVDTTKWLDEIFSI